jgi:hypothetical protein
MAVNQPCAPPLRVTALFAASCARLAPLAVPLTPVPGLVMPNASGCAAAGSFSPACRLDASSSLGQNQCGAPVCAHQQIQRPRTDFPCIGVGVRSRAPLRLWCQRLIDFPSRSRRRAPPPPSRSCNSARFRHDFPRLRVDDEDANRESRNSSSSASVRT